MSQVFVFFMFFSSNFLIYSFPLSFCFLSVSPHQHQLKKVESRRLDYDYKKKRQGKIPDEELRASLEKFHEAKEAAEISMHNLLETDVSIDWQCSFPKAAQYRYITCLGFRGLCGWLDSWTLRMFSHFQGTNIDSAEWLTGIFPCLLS